MHGAVPQLTYVLMACTRTTLLLPLLTNGSVWLPATHLATATDYIADPLSQVLCVLRGSSNGVSLYWLLVGCASVR
jgi:hypothetical protein